MGKRPGRPIPGQNAGTDNPNQRGKDAEDNGCTGVYQNSGGGHTQAAVGPDRSFASRTGAECGAHVPQDDPAAAVKTATPIKHLVVIFNENISLDLYFGTYPVASNPSGEPAFYAKAGRGTAEGAASALRKAGPGPRGDPTPAVLLTGTEGRESRARGFRHGPSPAAGCACNGPQWLGR